MTKTAQETLRFVELEEARTARGVRLLALSLLPSPWTEAAKAIFHVKEIPVLCVRHIRGDAAQIAWSGVRNAPAVFFDDEAPRSGWAEILLLAERLGGKVSLIPSDPAQRGRLFGLAHELCGEDGLAWNTRHLMIHGSLSTGGARSFPLIVGQSLAVSYGYAPGRIGAVRRRIRDVLALLDDTLAASRAAGHGYLLGDRLSAIDLYLATFLTPIIGVSPEDCPAMSPRARSGFEYLRAELVAGDGAQIGAGAVLPEALAEHRRRIYRDHLPWPIVL
jgi:glutathione S-transferase